MGFGNIFDDPEIKKQILEESGVSPRDEVDYEIIDPEVEQGGIDSFKGIINNAPKIPGGNSIKTIIRDASALVKDDQKAREAEMHSALSNIFTQYNKEYNVDLKVDLNNFTKTLVACSDERKTKILELFVSKVVRSIRPILILNMISKLAMALDVLLAPDKLLNPNELSLTDLFLATSQILEYIEKLEALKDEITIKNEDLELKKLAEESGLEYQDQDEQMVQDFMELFKKENLGK